MGTLKAMLIGLLVCMLVACGETAIMEVKNEYYHAKFYDSECQHTELAMAVIMGSGGEKVVKGGKVVLFKQGNKELDFCYALISVNAALVMDTEGNGGVIPLMEEDDTPKTGV